MLHPDLLRSFLAVADSSSFTLAARQLGIAQSTISEHLSRLESMLGKTFIARDTHSVSLTPDGDALVGFARQIIEANGRMQRFVSGTELRGRIRLGAGEDFTSSVLRRVLASFTARHSLVDLQLTVGLSWTLYQSYDAGDLDVIIVKRRSDDDRGHLAWREQLVWIGRPDFVVDPALPLPLVLYPPPSITRALAIEALESIGRSWRVACTTGSLTGLRAATEAGLGLAPHSIRLLPQGLMPIPTSETLPPLPSIEFVVLGPGTHQPVGSAMVELILASVDPWAA
jgi:DNA-binding transcriptional LysR family regulator